MAVKYIGNQNEVDISAMVYVPTMGTEEPDQWAFPILRRGVSLICVIDMLIQQECYQIENLADAKAIWQQSVTRGAIEITWYTTTSMPPAQISSTPYDPATASFEDKLAVTFAAFTQPPVKETVYNVGGGQDEPSFIRQVILDIADRNSVVLPKEVIAAIEGYAIGASGVGVANRLTNRSLNFTSARQVEELVGWPLNEHTAERSQEIYLRYGRDQ